MNHRLLPAMLALLLGLPAAAQDAAPPLNAAELGRCARQVQTLRQESLSLRQRTAALDSQRRDINLRGDSLREASSRLADDDLKGGLALHDRRIKLSGEAEHFNADIEALRNDIEAINAVRADYDRHCSQRRYSRRDLDALPAEEQAAMRAGLADVQVPYLADDAALVAP